MPTPHSMETLAKNRSSARSRSLNPPNWSSHRKIADFSSSRNLSTTDPGTFPACIAASRSLGRVSTGLLTWHPSKKPWTAKQSRAGFYPVSEYWSNFSLSWQTETPFLLPNRFFETAKLGKTLNIYIYIYMYVTSVRTRRASLLLWFWASSSPPPPPPPPPSPPGGPEGPPPLPDRARRRQRLRGGG